MTDLLLTFYERLCLWNMIGNYQAPRLAEVAVLLRALDKLRPSDAEALETELIVRDGQMGWKLPEPSYGERTVALEAEEVAALVKVFESLQDIRVADGAWIVRLIEQLKPVVAIPASA